MPPTVPPPQLILTVPQETVAGFASLLQHGVLCPIDRPIAVLPFLLSLPGFNAEYIENRVQTIFVNGIAVDSLDRVLSAGSTLALSAAMPGLAGAIFRRQGLHGSLRSQPEAKATSSILSDSGFITLKLFNTIATDRVHDLLASGILISGKAFCDFAARREHLFQPPARLLLADQVSGYAELLATLAGCPILSVQASFLLLS
jgi:hypothetical protein